MNHEALAMEMRGLREQVTGITDTAVAAADGLLIAADTADTIDSECLAAIAAAGLGIARRTTAAAGRGTFRQTVTYGSQGCAAFYAVGDTALMVVLGDEGIDLERLHEQTRPALGRIGSILTAPESVTDSPPATAPESMTETAVETATEGA
ncbi:roadblock/LC7 domain-containing protein [Streptomyces sp. NBC_00038]|uniref:roadblock/LC7 domain-containing protein n=1 Tax=Streptomyces sp. NBC_00038 TaxID=2903615 RepID=UPI002257BAB0|nr:roadblock/LC7 domain-containing protein [Streptomyces sp. NBC_00038]MCX5560432.1 roadblock/LC7 domain-containing protein [Streptomyces sp. NBC_00038]